MWEREKRESWKGEGPEHWPRKRLEWFRERMAGEALKCLPQQADEIRAEVLAELWQEPERYCHRIPFEQYHGRGFMWEIDEAAVKAECDAILARRAARAERAQRDAEHQAESAEREFEATRFPDLEAWLAAERRGELCAPAPRGPHGWHLLYKADPKRATAMLVGNRDREMRWPRACRTCRAEFTWATDRKNAVRCASCRRSRHQERRGGSE